VSGGRVVEGGGWREGVGEGGGQRGGRWKKRKKRAYPLPTLPAQKKIYTNPRAIFHKMGFRNFLKKIPDCLRELPRVFFSDFRFPTVLLPEIAAPPFPVFLEIFPGILESDFPVFFVIQKALVFL
jgi:hypothetical protein